MSTNLKNLPTHTAAEVLDIAPENLEVANCYLTQPDVTKVAESLDISVELVTQILAKREVRSYIDNVFYNTGFNNRFKLRGLMDALIEKKLKDLDESEMGSSKDITEIIALSHKLTMDTMNAEIKLESLRSNNIKTQNNIMINENPGGSKYSSLIERLMTSDVIDV